jgi:hypothetical protein
MIVCIEYVGCCEVPSTLTPVAWSQTYVFWVVEAYRTVREAPEYVCW